MPGSVSTGAARSCPLFGNDLSVGRTGHPMMARRRTSRLRRLSCHLAAFCFGDAIRRQRAAIVPRARGRVLEIGIGPGRNLPFYDAGKVTALIGTGASNALFDGASPPFPLALHAWSPTGLPFPTDSVDTVVVTGALHRTADPAAMLAEIRRVLRSTGQLLFCEPGKASDAGVARWQRRFSPLWARTTGGHRLDLDIPRLLNRTGFALQAIDAQYLPYRPRPTGFIYWGAATIV